LENRNFTSRGAPQEASPEAIALEIRRLLSDPPLRESLGGWSREIIVKSYSMDMMAGEIQKVYRRLLR